MVNYSWASQSCQLGVLDDNSRLLASGFGGEEVLILREALALYITFFGNGFITEYSSSIANPAILRTNVPAYPPGFNDFFPPALGLGTAILLCDQSSRLCFAHSIGSSVWEPVDDMMNLGSVSGTSIELDENLWVTGGRNIGETG